MSFLSLAKGDPSARELLPKAISARYGLRPVMVDSVRLTLTGKGKGILGLPTARIITVSLVAVNLWRWEETRKLLGLVPIGKFATLLENGSYYESDGKAITQSHDAEAVKGIRRQLWGMLAFLLTPLMAQGITLQSIDAQTLQASRDADPNDTATLSIKADGNITVSTDCYDPRTKQPIKLTISSQGALQTLNGFTIPTQIAFTWGTRLKEIFTVTDVEVDPTIAPAALTLGSQHT